MKALGHHKMQPNALPDMQCTMFIKKPTRRPSEVYRLANQFREENTVVGGGKSVKNDGGMSMNEQRLKAEGLVRALPSASQC